MLIMAGSPVTIIVLGVGLVLSGLGCLVSVVAMFLSDLRHTGEGIKKEQ